MSKELDTYEKVAASLVLGIGRVFQGWIVRDTVNILVNQRKIMALRELDLPQQVDEFFSDLKKVSDEVFSGFDYLLRASFLAYVTTLFDTFLSETTKFLFLRNPASVGKETNIPFDALLAAESRPALIVEVVERKVRDISYLPFAGRIEFLHTRFGLEPHLPEEWLRKIEHYGTLRNTIVHDQAIYHQALDEDGHITLASERCPIHPTPVTEEEHFDAIVTFLNVALAVYEGVAGQVLKADDGGAFRKAVEAMIRAAEASQHPSPKRRTARGRRAQHRTRHSPGGRSVSPQDDTR